MKKKLILFVIFSLGTSFSLLSQNSFAKVYDIFHPGNESALNITQHKNEYFITGNGKKSLEDEPLNYSTFKIDNEGDLLKQSYSKHFSNQSPNSILKDGEDIYMVLSNKKSNKDFNTRLYIYHTNIDGDSLGMIRINHEDSIFLENRGIVKIGNDFYLLNFILRDIDKVFYWKTVVSHLIKVNQDGKIELEKEFPYQYTPENIYKKNNSEIVLFQHFTQTGVLGSENVAVFDVFDTLGHSIIHKEIEYPRGATSPPNLVITSDSSFVINLTSKNDSSKIYNFLTKLDKEGNQIWKYDYINIDTSQRKIEKRIDGIYAASNGDVLGFGYCNYYKLYGEEDNIKHEPWIFRINKDGELLWERYLFENLENEWFSAHFNSISEDSNKNILLVGDYTPYNQDTVSTENKYFSFVVKLDSTGCFSSDCDNNVVLDIDWIETIDALQELSSIENVKIYPNPSSDYIRIESIEISKIKNWKIYNISGNCIKTGQNLNSENLNISNLQSGIYFIQIFNKNGRFAIGRFVKE